MLLMFSWSNEAGNTSPGRAENAERQVERYSTLLRKRSQTNPLQYVGYSSADRRDCVGSLIYANWLTLTLQLDLKLISSFISRVIMLF